MELMVHDEIVDKVIGEIRRLCPTKAIEAVNSLRKTRTIKLKEKKGWLGQLFLA